MKKILDSLGSDIRAILVFLLGVLLILSMQQCHKPVPDNRPSDVVQSPGPKTPIKVNTPDKSIEEEIANGTLGKKQSKVVVKENDKPVKVVIPPTKVVGSDSNVVVIPKDPQATETQEVVIPPGGGTIELPKQEWELTIKREYSPFKVDVLFLPEPSLGLGYDLITVDLDRPFGLNLQLGSLSVGPFMAKSMISSNYYLGGELSKSLGRINANIGYGWRVGSGTSNLTAGISFNFK